jgi:prepilin-type N-terminal cleavage/methylation domain-containing protein
MKRSSHGFTLIEILIVISIIAAMFAVTVPISYNMYQSYKASLKAEEVLVFIAGLKRDSFLYSEAKVLSSKDGIMAVNGKKTEFGDTYIQIDTPIEFYKNGTTSGGILKIVARGQNYSLKVQALFGDLSMENGA